MGRRVFLLQGFWTLSDQRDTSRSPDEKETSYIVSALVSNCFSNLALHLLNLRGVQIRTFFFGFLEVRILLFLSVLKIQWQEEAPILQDRLLFERIRRGKCDPGRIRRGQSAPQGSAWTLLPEKAVTLASKFCQVGGSVAFLGRLCCIPRVLSAECCSFPLSSLQVCSVVSIAPDRHRITLPRRGVLLHRWKFPS